MSKITKPDISIQWSQAGSIAVPSDVKKQAGWGAEKPAFEYMNWLQNRQDTGIAYLYQVGIPEWDNTTEYQYAAGYTTYVQYNGVVYKALQVGTNKNPSTETAYWVRAFDSYGSASTVNNALTAHITNYGTLASLSNATTARSNLSVYSIAQVDAGFAPIAGNSAQTFLVGSASSANHAVRKSQLDAKTGQADETTAGIMEVATNAESAAGVSDVAAVTPLKLKYTLDNRNASESATGLIELATSAEVRAGVDTLRAITAAGLFSFPRTTGTGEWSFQIPGTPIVVKILNVTCGSGTSTTVTFTTPFPTRCRAAFYQSISVSGGVEGTQLFVKDLTTSSVKVTHSGLPSEPQGYILAIGE